MGPREELAESVEGRPEMAALVDDALEVLESCSSLPQVEDARVRLLGKKGMVTSVFKGLGVLPPEEKAAVGRIGNLLRQFVEQGLNELRGELEHRETERRLAAGALDVTLPGRKRGLGHRHLLAQVIREATRIFVGLGYEVAEGPEVELDYYNFEALNQPPYHPARSLNDTLYVRRGDPVADDPKDILLRTHTSPVQVRVMEKRRPPLYVISPGRAYRRDEIDATHSAVFHQVEGLAVDRDITLGHLKGTLEVFARKLFGGERDVRFRPHYFPFTEPSAEMDVSCFKCRGAGCSLCKGAGWLEILGCGLVDPDVFGHVGYDPEEYTGFAFGMGVERIAMLKYGIDDMRVFFEDDARFLRQF